MRIHGRENNIKITIPSFTASLTIPSSLEESKWHLFVFIIDLEKYTFTSYIDGSKNVMTKEFVDHSFYPSPQSKIQILPPEKQSLIDELRIHSYAIADWSLAIRELIFQQI